MANRFTGDNASAIRVLTFCKIIKEIHEEVIVISLDDVEPNKMNQYKGIKYISLRSLSQTFTAKALNYLLFKNRMKNAIDLLNQEYGIEGILSYDDIPLNAFLYLKKYSLQKKIKNFHDCVEWYSPQQFKWGVLGLPYVLKNLLNKYFISKQVSVFAISKYLEKYFQSQGIRTIRIPVIMDMKGIGHEKDIDENKLRLVYAGSPGKKDYLKEMLEALSNLSSAELRRIEFNLFGVNTTELINICLVTKDTISKCGSSITLHGKVPREIVFQFLEKADFTVLLRSPVLRYSKAGFPSKVVESLATSTPVICNLTSDLEDYLIDNNNSLIVESCTSSAFEDKLRIALSLSLEERMLLCSNARKTAEKYFDFRVYSRQVNDFLEQN